MNRLAYKPGLDVVLDRLRRLFAREAQDQLFAVCETPSRALADFAARHPEGFCPCPDPHERAAFWDRLLSERAAVEDDSVPSAYPSEKSRWARPAVSRAELCRARSGRATSRTPAESCTRRPAGTRPSSLRGCCGQ